MARGTKAARDSPPTHRGDAATWIVLRRIAATPRVPRGWSFDESRRRRGRDADGPRRQAAAAPSRIVRCGWAEAPLGRMGPALDSTAGATWMVRGDETPPPRYGARMTRGPLGPRPVHVVLGAALRQGRRRVGGPLRGTPRGRRRLRRGAQRDVGVRALSEERGRGLRGEAGHRPRAPHREALAEPLGGAGRRVGRAAREPNFKMRWWAGSPPRGATWIFRGRTGRIAAAPRGAT